VVTTGVDRANERFQAIYVELRDRICTNRYPPGAVLREAELAAEFGVSRTPVRQVLQKLSYDGLVEIRNGVGNHVTDVDTGAYADLYRLRMRMAELIGEFIDAEGCAAHIQVFEGLLEQARRLGAREDYTALAQMNIAVVGALNGLISSEPLREVTLLLYCRTARIWHQTLPSMDWREEADLVTSEIREILRSLRMGDLQGVGFVRRNFIGMAFARLQRHFAKVRDGLAGQAEN
jgi:DNA-binding GntR family transcriptional regulator